MRVHTWNMQGASHSTENKWNAGVAALAVYSEIIFLQECGAVPRTAIHIGLIGNIGPARGRRSLNLYRWAVSRRNLFILHYHWDIGSNRVNTCIITRVQPFAHQISWVDPPFIGGGRCAIGIQQGPYWWFCIHALSGGGNDVPGLINGCQARAAASGIPFAVFGDFNRNPRSWGPIAGVTKYPPDSATHNTNQFVPKSRLDYAAGNIPRRVQPGVVEKTMILSDHHPVLYNIPT
jgi:cytolethal distending toxin subunit B